MTDLLAPWRVERHVEDAAEEGESGDIYLYLVIDRAGNRVCETYDRKTAYVLAAAPELLTKLKNWEVWASSEYAKKVLANDSLTAQTRNVIAKAEEI